MGQCEWLSAAVEPGEIRRTIENCVVADNWEGNDDDGSIVMLGDVMFVRQSNSVHRRITGLLLALKNNASQTMIFASQGDERLAAQLKKEYSVSAQDTPLVEIVRQLGVLTRADIRLDVRALADAGIRMRESAKG